MNPSALSRRRFLQGSALLSAPLILPSRVWSQATAPSRRLAVGCIGMGKQMHGHVGNLLPRDDVQIVAVCDVDVTRREHQRRRIDAAYAKKTGEDYKGCAAYNDFRELLARKDIDIVLIATPDHWHAYIAIAAVRAGKDVYCEKPLTHNVHEARLVRETAAKAGVVTQMGIQIHATENYRRVVELIQGGAIGPVTEAHVWVSRAWGLQSKEAAEAANDRVFVTSRPAAMPVPEGLHWDLWVGGAPFRPYNEVYFPGPKWYRWWDFGNGTMSDLGSHWNDLPFWALQLQAPLAVEAFGPQAHPEIAPATMRAVYEFGARGDLPPVRVTWHQGDERPEIWKQGGIPQWRDGALFIGKKGMLLSDYGKHLLLPEKDFAHFTRPPQKFPKAESHHLEWINACKGKGRPLADFQYSGWLTESNHLGNVAFRAGRRLEWDAANARVTNTRAADSFLRRDYRKGWELPA